jgi:DNA polymerase
MTLKEINKEYDKLQRTYGDENLKAIYGGGCEFEPEVLFIFMNPTATNPASKAQWNGDNFPFIGTKNAWKVLNKLNLLDEQIYNEVKNKKNKDWTPDFATEVLENLKKHKIYLTNLAKCTQIDARGLKNEVFLNYLELLKGEINCIKPKKIVCFGNQVSSIFLGKNIKVGQVRKQEFTTKINEETYKTYSVFYPIGMGMRNISFVLEDINYILKD